MKVIHQIEDNHPHEHIPHYQEPLVTNTTHSNSTMRNEHTSNKRQKTSGKKQKKLHVKDIQTSPNNTLKKLTLLSKP